MDGKPLILLFANSLDAYFLSLGESFELKTINNKERGLRNLSRNIFDAVAVDITVSRNEGLAFLRVAARIFSWMDFVALVSPGAPPSPGELPEPAAGSIRTFEKNLGAAALADTLRDIVTQRKAGLFSWTGCGPALMVERVLDLKDSATTEENPAAVIQKMGAGLTAIIPGSAASFYSPERGFVWFGADAGPAEKGRHEARMISVFRTLSGADPTASEEDGISGEPRAFLPVIDESGVDGIFMIGLPPESAGGQFLKFLVNILRKTFLTHFEIRMRNIRDHLSGLFNRRYFYEALHLAWAGWTRDRIPASMLVFDMDHFKNINDNYGHTAGDAIISETGRLLQMHCPAGSIALRLGGDEFAVFLLGDEASKMDEFAALLLDTFRTRVFRGGGCPLHITISCGTANISDPGIENESQFFDAADKALYLAKKRGRNQTGRYTDTLQTPGAGQTESASPPAEPKDAPQSKGKILVVDDEIQIVELLKRLLTHCKYEVITANNPNKAFEIVKSHPDAIDVMLTDINMPEMSGTELLKAVASVAPNIVTVIISGYVTTENTVAALRAGAYNILAKPFKLDEIEIVVARAVERRRMKRELDAYHVGIEQLLQEKTKALNTAYDDLKDAYVKTMEIIIRMLDIHESDTALHSRRVSLYTLFLAGKMGVSDPEELKNIKYGALFHDIGKIAIPDSILKKPSTLTAGEMNIVRSHAHMGYEIVSSIPALKSAAEIVWSHHERFDGKGYPRGLAGKDICLGARIFSVVDTFDALRYDRSYRMGKGIEEVVAEINRCCGSQFDPEVVAVFNSCYMELDKIDVPLESDGGAPLL